MAYYFSMFFVIFAMTTLPAQANEHLSVKHAWSAPSIAASKVGVTYFTITNHSTTDYKIIAASSPVSQVVELHTHLIEDDIMQMRRLESVSVPAGHTVTAKPHSLHLMMIGLKSQLVEGDSYPVTLELDSGETLDITVNVKRNNGH